MHNKGGDSSLYLLLTRSCLKKYIGWSLSLHSIRRNDIVWRSPRRDLDEGRIGNEIL